MKKEKIIGIDESALYDEPSVPEIEQALKANAPTVKEPPTSTYVPSDSVVNCLRNEKVTVRFIPKKTDSIVDKKHVAYGGMMENAVRVFVPPMLTSGSYKNCLTNNEKACLEQIMGLEYNALSVHKRNNNFWDNFRVRLVKQDTILDLSDPNDYIKYKVLLANTDYVAPNTKVLKERPKATYQYVIIEENEENVVLKDSVNITMKCYESLGSYKDNYDVLKCVVETIEGRKVAANTKIEFLLSKAHDIISSNPKLFLDTITDPLIEIKILINKGVEKGVISKKGDNYYLREDASPLCEDNEYPTITSAARFLAAPKNQELKFAIEAKVK